MHIVRYFQFPQQHTSLHITDSPELMTERMEVSREKRKEGRQTNRQPDWLTQANPIKLQEFCYFLLFQMPFLATYVFRSPNYENYSRRPEMFLRIPLIDL